MKKNNNIRDTGIVDATAAGILQIFCGHYRNVDAITCYLYNQQILWRRHPSDWSYATLQREKWNPKAILEASQKIAPYIAAGTPGFRVILYKDWSVEVTPLQTEADKYEA